MDPFRPQAQRLELCNLIFHQCNEWADHERRPAARQARELVTERLARPGRHHQQHILAVAGRFADRLLVRAETGMAKGAREQLCSVSRKRRARLNSVDRLPGFRGERLLEGLRPGRRSRPAEHELHDLADIRLDPSHERRQLRLAPADRVQTGLPLAGHRRALDVGVDRVDQSDSLVGGLQRLAVAHDVFSRDQCLDDRRAGRRRAQPAILHGPREFSVVERLACRLHRCQQARVIEPFRGPRLFCLQSDITYRLGGVLSEARGKGLLLGVAVFLACRDVEHFPSGLDHGGADGVEAVDDGNGGSDRGGLGRACGQG